VLEIARSWTYKSLESVKIEKNEKLYRKTRKLRLGLFFFPCENHKEKIILFVIFLRRKNPFFFLVIFTIRKTNISKIIPPRDVKNILKNSNDFILVFSQGGFFLKQCQKNCLTNH